jgi:hypothetical protein
MDSAEQLIRQYELMVNSSLQVTVWRQGANNFFLAVNSALLAFATYLYSISVITGILIGIVGVAITILWYSTIGYYRSLNKAKFLVIQEIEKQLPVTMFKNEEDHFSTEKRKIATSIESKIPILFAISYIVLIAVLIMKLLSFYGIFGTA